tara:strand:+ start:1518 stop:2294 length:777 start_codon:yes stop_codon:yes gene_type:complete
MNINEEKELRSIIRHYIELVKEKRLNEEKDLRSIIGTLLEQELSTLNEKQTADVDPTPNKSTGINVLEDLLKKIVPVLETDYKSMTTDPEQRKSFRAHIIQAIINTLTPVEANTAAGEKASDDLDEEIDIQITDKDSTDDDKFIDIRTDAEKAEDEDPEDPRDAFGIQGADETGRNIAYSSFKKIESNIIDAYELLSNDEDQELFYDYLIANAKLYFDKFESELDPDIEEPTNKAYDMAKDKSPDLDEPTPDELDLGL